MDQIFSGGQRLLLSSVLTRIIPAEGELPGAGDLGLAQFVENTAAKDPAMVSLFNRGLRLIETPGTGGAQFGDLFAEAQEESLKSVESSDPEFFQELVRQTYNGYYTSPRVFEVIGHSPRNPASGEALELLDEDLLEKQRQRAPFWKKV